MCRQKFLSRGFVDFVRVIGYIVLPFGFAPVYHLSARNRRMFAVVNIAGKQYKVTQNDKIVVPTLKGDVGATVTFENVLMLGDEKVVKVGTPHVPGARVEATVLEHVAGPKVVVFKKKRRKGYRVKRGHKQRYTQVQIASIQE
jgi:large subunit ribosomal protein L21